ncbi:hypothetical protein [Cohnella sp. AR92]|uniref:hypothetical protein n=1 Tax=Cohnella sp. AR92 TaxID=648716 RepID=UPI000F8DF0CA|nr:hypothetical protein [Cohnella sp. AR92]RUS41938.1 hypothetical protein ELR57_27620 [Cohnella sp. AR92]
MKYDKEAIYDAEIAPLMAQIIAICKREELPFAAQFYLKEEREDTGEPMYCTTVIRPAGESEGLDQISFLNESMYYGRGGKPFVAAYTIRSEGGQ